MSQMEILSSLARGLCSAAQHFVYTNESSIHRSEQTVFIVFLKLPSSTIKKPLAVRENLPPPSSIWTKMQWECVHCSSFVQNHLHPFKTAPDYSWHRDPNFHMKMSLRNCHTFVHNLRAIQPNSCHHSTQNNFICHDCRHQETNNCQWDTSVQIPVFPSLSLISSFQDLMVQFFDVLPLYNPLAHLVLLDFSLPSLLDHDSLCLPLPDDCLTVLLRALQTL